MKGQLSFDVISMIPRIIFLIVVIISIPVMVQIGLTSEYKTEKLEVNLVVDLLLNTATGIAVGDENGIAIIGTVDSKKIKTNYLETNFGKPQQISAKLSLFERNSDGSLGSTLKTGFINKEKFIFDDPRAQGFTGAGAFEKVDRWIPLLEGNEKRYIHLEVIKS